MRSLWRATLVALALGSGVASADTFYVGSLTGAQEVPPSGADATGFGRVRLNESETQIIVSLHFSGLSGPPTAAHIHGPAGIGTNGPVVFPFSPPAATSGAILNLPFAVSPQQVEWLKSGLLYFNIHSASFPGGEIRGQIRLNPVLTTTMSGAQVVGGVSTPAAGRAFVSLDAAGTQALVSAEWTSLSAAGGAARLHLAPSGTDGASICELGALAGPAGALTDVLCALTPEQARALRTGGAYVQLSDASFPSGELRGQIKRTFNPCDFDGDGASDRTVVRSDGVLLTWWIQHSSDDSTEAFQWGTANSQDQTLCGDVDGDGKADATVFQDGPPAQFWSRLSSGGVSATPWGLDTDNPSVTADYDGDGRDDLTVWRGGVYWTRLSTTGGLSVVPWGQQGDFPSTVPDHDGDGKADFAVQRAAHYWTLQSSDGAIKILPFGLSSDFTHAADFDGDGRTDYANTRISGSSRQWWIRSSLRSNDSTLTLMSPYGNGFLWGSTLAPSALRAAADFDGDGRTDIGVFKASAGGPGHWWVLNTRDGSYTVRQWGIDGDRPVISIYWK